MKTRAAFITKTGGPDVIQWGEVDLPELNENQVLVKTEFVAMNPVDTYIRAGKMPSKVGKFPFIIGSDLVGTVEKVGSKVKNFKVGQKVWTPRCNGAAAEHAIVDADVLFEVPNGADPQQLVALAQVASTACRGLIQSAQLHANETLFVQGAGGCVGSTLIQLAKALGAQVIAATTGEEKMAWCRELGADQVLDYKKQESANVKGVQVFWDTSREPNFELATKVLAPKGRIVLMSGAESRPIFPVGNFYRNELTLKGFSLFHATPIDLQGYADIINRCVEVKKLKAKIAKVLPLSEASEAQRLLDENKVWGKVILAVK